MGSVKKFRRLSLAIGLSAMSWQGASAEQSVPRLETIQQQIDAGEFTPSKVVIEQLLASAQSLSPEQHDAFAFELERMRRIERDFPYDFAALLKNVRRYIPQATEQDVQAWLAQNVIESMLIDGEMRYFKSSGFNLMHLSPTALARHKQVNPQASYDKPYPLYQVHPHHSDVLNGKDKPVRFEIEYKLTVNADAIPAGELLKAWLPYPKPIEGRQYNIELVSSTPDVVSLAPADTAQRTAYFEAPAKAGEKTAFSIRYRYTAKAWQQPIDPEKVLPLTQSERYQEYLAERLPHIQFSDELRQLSARIVGDETNPYRIAQKLFAWVDTIPWATAREYSTIRNLSEYAATTGHADCGQQTMLLMTLLRMNGIPSRWESGWEFSDSDFDTMHDWGQFYLAPYGWLPMDVTHGVLNSNQPELAWFYLGGIDAYRLIFNSDYSQPFVPQKQYVRSETLDSQRGEVEWQGGNLYFDQWRYSMTWKIVDSE